MRRSGCSGRTKIALCAAVLLALGLFASAGAGIAAQDATPTPSLDPVQAALARAQTFSGSNDEWEPFEWEINGQALVLVPAGCFMMGSTPDQIDAAFAQCEADYGAGDCDRAWFMSEGPQHRVCFDEPFWIGTTEVTNAQFAAFLNAMGNQREGGVTWLKADSWYVQIHQGDGTWLPDVGFENHPVVQVSWYGARAYAEWAGCSLPTEAQWEYAARGPDALIYPWGNQFDCNLGNFDDETVISAFTVGDPGCDGFHGTAPVGSFPGGVSWVGALNMGGNVMEWGTDWIDQGYYRTLDDGVVNPTGPADGLCRALRGGAWIYSLGKARTAFRDGLGPQNRLNRIGFRMACPVQ